MNEVNQTLLGGRWGDCKDILIDERVTVISV